MTEPSPGRIVGVIPARYDSSRFPGKVLAPIDGLPMVARVYSRVREATLLDSVVVATDSRRVTAALEELDIPVLMTSSDCRTGTDRVAEVARTGEGDIYVNVQGDQPFIEGEVIEKAVEPFLFDRDLKMGTIASRLLSVEEWTDPNVVKMVVSEEGFAEDFFRTSTEPYPLKNTHKHIGLYVFQRAFLLQFAGMKQTDLEKARHLEQMRALDHGIPIKVVLTDHDDFRIDTPEDLRRVREVLGIG